LFIKIEDLFSNILNQNSAPKMIMAFSPTCGAGDKAA
jgi:hypothetical protein